MNINELYDVYEKMDPQTYVKTINEKMNKVLPSLVKLQATVGETTYSGLDLLANFMIATVLSDYKVSESEIALLSDVLTQCIDKKYDVVYTTAILLAIGKNIEAHKTFADAMIDGLGKINPELKEDLVLICLLVAAVDGNVSAEEREYLARLLA